MLTLRCTVSGKKAVNIVASIPYAYFLCINYRASEVVNEAIEEQLSVAERHLHNYDEYFEQEMIGKCSHPC